MISSQEPEVEKRARKIFLACAKAYSKQEDPEGVITVKDLPELLRQVDPALLSLDEAQQQELFRTLDANQDGAITLAELTAALSSFCATQPERAEKPTTNTSADKDSGSSEVTSSVAAPVGLDSPDTKERPYRPRLTSIAVNSRLSEEMTFVSTVEQQSPQLLEEVAKLMVAIENAIQTREAEVQALQVQIESQKASREREIHDLYEEMESKIKQECDLVTSEVQVKGRYTIELLRKRIDEKEKQLSELESKQTVVLEEVAKMNARLTETQNAVKELTANKEALEELLLKAELNLEEKHSDMRTLQKTLEEEKRKRATKSSGLHSELEAEYEQLLSQIANLRMANRKLLDERDERCSQRQPSLSSITEDPNVALFHQLQSEPSFDEVSLGGRKGSSVSLSMLQYQAQMLERRGSETVKNGSKMKSADNTFPTAQPTRRFTSLSEHTQPPATLAALRKGSLDQRRQPSPTLSITSITSYGATTEQPAPMLTTGASVFKIFVVGSSGVGKTSVVQRFCNNLFSQNYQETIGVEFQIKTILLESRPYVLQLWDTAGQSRFRSLILQCGKKADGLVFVYDPCKQDSLDDFNIWMTHFLDTLSNKTKGKTMETARQSAVMILANKADLIELPESSSLAASNQEPLSPGLDQWEKYPIFKQGLQMAKRQNALFYPVSAKMGLNLPHAFKRFARRLRELEDEEMKLHLQNKLPADIKVKPDCCACCPCFLS